MPPPYRLHKVSYHKTESKYDNFFAIESLTSSAENLGWWYLNSRGSYSAVCWRDFPMQGDVAPKVGVGSKNFHSKTTEGAHCLHYPRLDFLSFCLKVFGILKTFFQKGFKWVWAKPTTFLLLKKPCRWQFCRVWRFQRGVCQP